MSRQGADKLLASVAITFWLGIVAFGCGIFALLAYVETQGFLCTSVLG